MTGNCCTPTEPKGPYSTSSFCISYAVTCKLVGQVRHFNFIFFRWSIQLLKFGHQFLSFMGNKSMLYQIIHSCILLNVPSSLKWHKGTIPVIYCIVYSFCKTKAWNFVFLMYPGRAMYFHRKLTSLCFYTVPFTDSRVSLMLTRKAYINQGFCTSCSC